MLNNRLYSAIHRRELLEEEKKVELIRAEQKWDDYRNERDIAANKAIWLVKNQARARVLIANAKTLEILRHLKQNFVMYRDYVEYRIACFMILIKLLGWRFKFKKYWG